MPFARTDHQGHQKWFNCCMSNSEYSLHPKLANPTSMTPTTLPVTDHQSHQKRFDYCMSDSEYTVEQLVAKCATSVSACTPCTSYKGGAIFKGAPTQMISKIGCQISKVGATSKHSATNCQKKNQHKGQHSLECRTSMSTAPICNKVNTVPAIEREKDIFIVTYNPRDTMFTNQTGKFHQSSSQGNSYQMVIQKLTETQPGLNL